MSTMNKDATRYYSQLQESFVANRYNGRVCPNSGAGRFDKSDVVVDEVSMDFECKTVMEEKKSFTIKKEWLDKQKEEAFRNRLYNTALVISFDPSGKNNYYVIDQKLMDILMNALREEDT